ncbi:MAG: cbb3-type cytochrome oxidase assembly protein CcoS [Alphaproteobacteria bacterium]|nr:MAG: cbb3-type cytochrome oxidase assembly protein CcoS [Alphaproteobacteria bacterium]
MPESIIILIFLSLCLGTGVWLIFLWAARKGEFDDTEGPKYRMLADDDPPASKSRNPTNHDHESPHD